MSEARVLDTESIWIELLLPSTKGILLCNCYRPPNDNAFLDNIEEAFSKIEPNREIHVLGDINIDFNKNDNALPKKYLAILRSFNCKQLITEATRITETSGSVLDHALTNDSGKVKSSGVLEDSISDHLPVYLLRCFRNKEPGTIHNPLPKKVRSLKNYSSAVLGQELRETDWRPVLFAINVDDALEKFVNIFHCILDKIAPVRELRIKELSAYKN